MFRNTLCEAEPDEPGERSAFGAIRTGIELCERQPRQSSGSIGQPDLAPDAMPDAVLIVPAAGIDRIVAQRAEVEMLEFLSAVLSGLRYPGRTGHDRDRIVDRIIARTALRTATYERRRLEQQIRNGSGPMREPAANGAERKPDTDLHAVGTDSPRQQQRVRIGKSHRTEQRQLIARDELPADIAAQQTRKCARPEIRVPRSTGRRPVRRQSSTVPDLRRQRTPRRAMPSNRAFPIARRVSRNVYRNK